VSVRLPACLPFVADAWSVLCEVGVVASCRRLTCRLMRTRAVCVCGLAAEVRMFWHPQGEFLAVQVDRYTKTKKSTYTSFELFSVRARDIPMEVLDLPNKSERVGEFAWEPKVG
jgi:Eukaryotic translation initiation factor eIF2A